MSSCQRRLFKTLVFLSHFLLPTNVVLSPRQIYQVCKITTVGCTSLCLCINLSFFFVSFLRRRKTTFLFDPIGSIVLSVAILTLSGPTRFLMSVSLSVSPSVRPSVTYTALLLYSGKKLKKAYGESLGIRKWRDTLRFVMHMCVTTYSTFYKFVK